MAPWRRSRRARVRCGGACWCVSSMQLAIPAIALSRLRRMPRGFPHVAAQRLSEIVRFANAPLLVATDQALVAVGRNEFALAAHDRLLMRDSSIGRPE